MAAEPTEAVVIAVAARRLVMVALLIAIAVGLGDRDAPVDDRLPELDIVVVVDRTTSMSALDDPSGSRITAVRRDLVSLGERFESARYTVITAGRQAETVLPTTSDRVAFEDAVRALQVEEATVGRGSAPDRFVPLVDALLDRIEADPDRLPVLVYAGDGEDTVSWDASVLTDLAGRFRAAAVLGYGSDAGGVMPLVRVPVGASPPPVQKAGALVPDTRTGSPAVSRLDAANLAAIAESVGGRYVRADGSHDVGAVAADLQRAAYADLEPVEAQRQVSWLWGLLLLLLALPEARSGWRQWLAATRAVRS